MINEMFMPELVRLAKEIPDIKNWQPRGGMCGCLGPKKKEYLCPCAQRLVLGKYKVDIVAQYDEELAKDIMLTKIVEALPG